MLDKDKVRFTSGVCVSGCREHAVAKVEAAVLVCRAVQCPILAAQQSRIIVGPVSPLVVMQAVDAVSLTVRNGSTPACLQIQKADVAANVG